MIQKTNPLTQLKNYLLKEKKTITELNSLFEQLDKAKDTEEKNMISSQINSLKNSLKKTSKDVLKMLEKTSLVKPLVPKPQIQKIANIKPSLFDLKKKPKTIQEKPEVREKPPIKNIKPSSKFSIISKLEEQTLKRLRKKEAKVAKKKIKKPSKYVQIANRIFSHTSRSFLKKTFFRTLERDLIKSKIQVTPASYISLILFTTLLSVIAGIFVFLFFLFFNIGVNMPIITAISESVGDRLFKVFWILFIVPMGTFLIMYFYPSLERKTAEIKINRELPFAAIHMSAISGSMIEPSKIFNIIISTKEYPSLEKEFIKLINEINIYGHDLATALRNVAFNSPSSKLAELLNGMATTIKSGGDLPKFFDKRSQTLLFEHRIEREKHTKSAETFMDIYISVVIAAPMILMLLLMMMSISGLSWLSPSMITLIMVLGVSVANIIFLTFLHLKGSTE